MMRTRQTQCVVTLGESMWRQTPSLTEANQNQKLSPDGDRATNEKALAFTYPSFPINKSWTQWGC